MLSLFLVELPDDIDLGYDSYTSFIVATSTKEKARNYHPVSHPLSATTEEEYYELYADQWVKPNDISKLIVKYLGVASPDLQEGVILAVFHPG